MSILAIGYYNYASGLLAAMVAALLTRRKVLQGRFGKFAIFEHIILPAIFIMAGVIIGNLVEIDKVAVTGIIFTLSVYILAMLMFFGPYLFLAGAFLAYAFITSWEQIAQIAAASFVGVTIGNMIGFGLGSRAQTAAAR